MTNKISAVALTSTAVLPGPLPCSLTDLIPAEIYDHFISCLSKDSLNSSGLVCKAWLPASRFWLFSKSKVTILRTNIDAFLELVARRDEPFSIIPFIQHLVLEQGGSHRLPFWGADGDSEVFQFNDFLQKFQSLLSVKSLRLGWIRADIGPSVPVALHTNFYTLEELELNSVVLSSVQQFFDILDSLPHLSRLSLSGFSFEYEVVDGRIHNRTLESTPAPPSSLRIFLANVKESISQYLFAWLAFHKMTALHTVAFGLFSKQGNEVLSSFLRESGSSLQTIKIWDAYTAAGIDFSPCTHLEILRLGWICLFPQMTPGSARFATDVLETVDSPCLKEIMIVIRLEKGGNNELQAFDWDGLASVLQKPCFKNLEKVKLSVSCYKKVMTKAAEEKLSMLRPNLVEVVQWTLSENSGRWGLSV